MALRCNIDAKGKLVRLLSGVATLVVAVVLAALWAWPAGTVTAWAVAGACAAAGAFMVFEAWAGWCAVRALGVKTRL